MFNLIVIAWNPGILPKALAVLFNQPEMRAFLLWYLNDAGTRNATRTCATPVYHSSLRETA